MRWIIFLFLLVTLTPVQAQQFYVPTGGQPRSQVVANFLGQGGEYKFLNLIKEGPYWTYGDNTGNPLPNELDANGWPLFGANAFAGHSGVYQILTTPSQAEKPGNYVQSWVGGGEVSMHPLGVTSSAGVSCTGVQSGTGNINCDNSGCSSFTGSISGTTLTVTAAPTGTGCSLVQGQPISGAGVTISAYGVPTIITSSGSTCGANTCYTVNFSQTVGSESMQPGGRNVVSVTGEQTTAEGSWSSQIVTTSSGNTVQYLGLYNVNDESTYWTGQQSGVDFKRRMKEGNFATIRDLNLTNSNQLDGLSNCTTWVTRKPASYFSYGSIEPRNSLYVGGSNGGSISYNAGSDTYSITFGSGNWSDKQTIIVQWPATGTTSSKVSLNGNTAVSLLTFYGAALDSSTDPVNGKLAGLVYNATLGGVLSWGGNSHWNALNCGVPPEAFINMNVELGTNPWIVAQNLAVEPMTDFYPQYATYIKTNFPSMVPEFETPDEMWNCAGGVGNYFSAISRVYIATNPAAWSNNPNFCGTGGAIEDMVGKVGSTLGQAISSVYSSPSQYEMIVGVKTGDGNSTSNWSPALLSTAYMAQNTGLLPIQPGYTQTPAYDYATRVAIANYWGVSASGTQPEVAEAYCYFTQASGCASLATLMSNYMATQEITAQNTGDGLPLVTVYANWGTFATTCAGHGAPCGVKGYIAYEGTYANGTTSQAASTTATASNNSANCILTAPNGGVAGMSVTISAASGGTWSTVVGNTYTVQATGLTTSALPINLNCSGLGTLASATITYTGSANYINWFRNNAWLSSDMYNLTLLNYQKFVAGGGKNPSQFTLGGALTTSSSWTGCIGCYEWVAWDFSIYGHFPLASCTSCTVSGTTLTLGGTVTGIFQAGQTLFGAGVTTPTTVTGGCVLSGSAPCGSNSGDTLTISRSLTIASGESMTGNTTPPSDPAGTDINSPITQWGAIRAWNGNSGG